MAKQTEELISRRGIFIVSFQLEGICTALRLILQCGASPGETTITILQKLQSDFTALLTSGRTVEGIPLATSEMETSELLAIAEVLRNSAMSFLSPDEADQRKRAIGFTE